MWNWLNQFDGSVSGSISSGVDRIFYWKVTAFTGHYHSVRNPDFTRWVPGWPDLWAGRWAIRWANR